MFYADMHCHLLYGVDDGAETWEDTIAMLEAHYAQGTRAICFTPHFQPMFYGNTADAAAARFEEIRAYVAEKYPDLSLYLANELGYYTDCLPTLTDGSCRKLGGRYVLLDFLPDVTFFTAQHAVESLLAAGYPLILAHPERYHFWSEKRDAVENWCYRGALLQIDASAFAEKMSWGTKRYLKKMLERGFVAAVASDAHDMGSRPVTVLATAERKLTHLVGERMARALLYDRPLRLMRGEKI